MGNDRRIERRSSGFTLIELLAVIIILSILAFFLLTNLTDVLGTTDVQVTKITAQKISAALHELANDNGDFAPSSLPSDLGAPPNMDNLGSESLYVALLADGKPGFGLFDENISNTDDDALARRRRGSRCRRCSSSATAGAIPSRTSTGATTVARTSTRR